MSNVDLFLPQTTMTIGEMNEMIKKLKEIDEKIELLDAEKKQLGAQWDKLERDIIEILSANGMTSYKLNGVAAISIRHKMSVTTPKSLEDKVAFKEWLVKEFGDDAPDNYLSIDSNTLNSLYNEKYEEACAKGAADIFHIEGVGMPTTRTILSVRKA